MVPILFDLPSTRSGETLAASTTATPLTLASRPLVALLTQNMVCDPLDWIVLFNLSNSPGRGIGLHICQVTILGCASAAGVSPPDLDLSLYGAGRCGVSACHALIRPSALALYLIDLNSLNGTWVNGQRLQVGQEVQLSDGDTIELGAFRMTLQVIHAPADGVARRSQETPGTFNLEF